MYAPARVAHERFKFLAHHTCKNNAVKITTFCQLRGTSKNRPPPSLARQSGGGPLATKWVGRLFGFRMPPPKRGGGHEIQAQPKTSPYHLYFNPRRSRTLDTTGLPLAQRSTPPPRRKSDPTHTHTKKNPNFPRTPSAYRKFCPKSPIFAPK